MAFSHFGKNILSYKLPITWFQIFCWHNIFNIFKHWVTGSRHLQEALEKTGISKHLSTKPRPNIYCIYSHKEKTDRSIYIYTCNISYIWGILSTLKQSTIQRYFLMPSSPNISNTSEEKATNRIVGVFWGFVCLFFINLYLSFSNSKTLPLLWHGIPKIQVFLITSGITVKQRVHIIWQICFHSHHRQRMKHTAFKCLLQKLFWLFYLCAENRCTVCQCLLSPFENKSNYS